MNGLIPCLSLIGALALILALLTWMRHSSYKGTIARAESGLPRPERSMRNRFLRWGILVAGLGLALSVGLYPIGFSGGDDYPLHLGPWMLGGFVPLFLGLGLILLHFLTQKD